MSFPQRCKLCGRDDGFNFNVQPETWAVVARGRYNVLCLKCFDYLASVHGIDYSESLDREIVFVGNAVTMTMEVTIAVVAEGLTMVKEHKADQLNRFNPINPENIKRGYD